MGHAAAGRPLTAPSDPCDSLIDTYFGLFDAFDSVGEAVFKRQLYHCLLGQALSIKANIETRRSKNEFG